MAQPAPPSTAQKRNSQAEFLCVQALQLLDEAQVEGGTLEPSSAAGLFLVIGQAYTPVDKKKAKEALELAYQNMRAAMTQSPDLVGFMAMDLIGAIRLNKIFLQKNFATLLSGPCVASPAAR